MRTTLGLVLLLSLCALSSSQECRRELLENVDFPGTDIKQLYSPDVNHCQQLCTQHNACLFFTFLNADFTRDKRHFYCYLKRTDSGNPRTQTSLLGVVSGYSLKPCSSNIAPCFDKVYPNIDFPGADFKWFFTSSHEECQRACSQDLSCQFFTWANSVYSDEKIRHKCFLKFSQSVPLTSVVRNKPGLVSGFSINVNLALSPTYFQECNDKYFPGADIPGHNVADFTAASPEHCQMLCAAHHSCTYFTYSGTTCFLKNNPNELVVVAKQGVTSGLPSRHCQQNTKWLEVAHEGVDFPSSDIKFVMLDSPEQCQRACNDDVHCQFYTYVKETFVSAHHWRRCYMKRAITMPAPPKVTKLVNVVSGFPLRNCGPV